MNVVKEKIGVCIIAMLGVALSSCDSMVIKTPVDIEYRTTIPSLFRVLEAGEKDSAALGNL